MNSHLEVVEIDFGFVEVGSCEGVGRRSGWEGEGVGDEEAVGGEFFFELGHGAGVEVADDKAIFWEGSLGEVFAGEDDIFVFSGAKVGDEKGDGGVFVGYDFVEWIFFGKGDEKCSETRAKFDDWAGEMLGKVFKEF